MEILHLIQFDSASRPDIASGCLRVLNKGDIVVIMGDPDPQQVKKLLKLFTGENPECKVRVLNSEINETSAISIDYTELVQLSCQYKKVVSWF